MLRPPLTNPLRLSPGTLQFANNNININIHGWRRGRKREERERERDCCGQWRGLEARQCECWTKTSTTPETCLLLLSSPPYLSLSQIELNWIIVFDFSDSDICYAIVTFYYFEILGNDSGGNIGYVSPNLFFKRRRLKCAHWPPTTAWITNLYFFFFLRNYKFCTLKKKKLKKKIILVPKL